METNETISDSKGADSTPVSSIKAEPECYSGRKSALLANH